MTGSAWREGHGVVLLRQRAEVLRPQPKPTRHAVHQHKHLVVSKEFQLDAAPLQ